jgi:DNA repair protein RecO (recombination protein O)
MGIRRYSRLCPATPGKSATVVPTTDAIVLRLTRLTETSLIVHWFSADLGLVKTVARGARRPKSPFNGQIDLFFGGEITFSPARGGELHHLREVAIHHWREGLRRNYTTTLLAGYFCQLLETAVEPEHPDPDLHDLLRRALDHLDASEPTLRSLVFFESELARLLGIAHHRQAAAISLADVLGKLPHSRNDLVERLAPRQDFSSSGDTIDR